jgi:hypothetical protein
MYYVQCNILLKDGANHTNFRATLSNDRTIKKENGGGTIVVRATQDTFEVIMEI